MQHGKHVILLVDDDQDVLDGMRLILETKAKTYRYVDEEGEGS